MFRFVRLPLPSLGKFASTAAFLLILGSAPLVAHAQLKDEVSDITGIHRVASESLRDVLIETYSGDDVGLRAEYVADEGGEVAWRLSFYGFADAETGFATAPGVRLVADDVPVQPLEISGKTRTMSDGSVLEVRTLVFTRPVFTQIAEATSVEASIGQARLQLSEYARRDMDLILERVLPVNGQRTASSDSGSTGS